MNALISVGGQAFPEPSSYTATTSTIVDAARNVSGRMVGNVVRYDVAKIEVSWKYLTVEQWANILSKFSKTFVNDVYFFNQTTGTYTTKEMYVSDRNASAWRRDPNSGEVLGWVNPSLSLVEA